MSGTRRFDVVEHLSEAELDTAINEAQKADGPRQRIGVILLVQTVASAALFVVVALVDTVFVAAIAFVVLGFFVFGFTGVYYSCMTTVFSVDEMGSATGGASWRW